MQQSSVPAVVAKLRGSCADITWRIEATDDGCIERSGLPQEVLKLPPAAEKSNSFRSARLFLLGMALSTFLT